MIWTPDNFRFENRPDETPKDHEQNMKNAFWRCQISIVAERDECVCVCSNRFILFRRVVFFCFRFSSCVHYHYPFLSILPTLLRRLCRPIIRYEKLARILFDSCEMKNRTIEAAAQRKEIEFEIHVVSVGHAYNASNGNGVSQQNAHIN